MKRIFKVMLSVILMTCLWGCNEKENLHGDSVDNSSSAVSGEDENIEASRVRYAEMYQLVSLSESGIIYGGKDGKSTGHITNVERAL